MAKANDEFYSLIKAGWEKNFENPRERLLSDSDLFPGGDLFCSLLPSPARILDSGCGVGDLAISLSRSKYTVAAIDYSERAIEAANVAVAKESLPCKPDFHVCPMEGPLPFDSSTFDGVIMSKSLHCVLDEHRDQAMQESLRVLKMCGFVYFSVLSTEDEFMPRSSWEQISKNTWKDVWFNRVFHFYSNAEIDKLMQSNSLEQVSRQTIQQNKVQDKLATFHVVIAKKK